ncbi:MAG: phytanoyl-CoA dioxygenase family protein [Candidatus Latescibacterota bacterium]|nr:phytanoyl-CoA dioxygenase family protein [Candidatus Latescibacterota bacterium]
MTTPPLSDHQLSFFKTHGYLILRQILDPALLAKARARLWDAAPPSMRRDDPTSWVGPVSTKEESDDRDNYRRGFRWQYRKIGPEPWMVEMLPKNRTVWNLAQQLLGRNRLVEPTGVRGIYCTLPYGDHETPPLGCHVDAHPFHFGVVAYMDDVDPGGGGFRVWPGSHRRFYYDFETAYQREPNERYEPDKAEIGAGPSVDCYGKAGDVVLWHHRIGHMAAPNTTRRIRQAVLYDFRKDDWETTQSEPPAQDMWKGWSDELRAAPLLD